MPRNDKQVPRNDKQVPRNDNRPHNDKSTVTVTLDLTGPVRDGNNRDDEGLGLLWLAAGRGVGGKNIVPGDS